LNYKSTKKGENASKNEKNKDLHAYVYSCGNANEIPNGTVMCVVSQIPSCIQ